MELYTKNENKELLFNGSIKMLKDKYNLSINNDELLSILNDIYLKINNKYKNNNKITLNELNKFTLINIKEHIDNYIRHQHEQQEQQERQEQQDKQDKQEQELNKKQKNISIEKIENTLLDNDVLNLKLKELEMNRRIIPSINTEILKDDKLNNMLFNQQHTNPISITIPQQNIIKNYKHFIINSNNRDWFLNSNRNNLKVNVSINIKQYIMYPECICFPKYIKNITPYILMNISDGVKNIIYTFICKVQNDKWDIWEPCCNDIEKIDLNNQSWIITFYDFTNNLLDIGNDNIGIVNIEKHDKALGLYKLKINNVNNFNKNDKIILRAYNGIFHNIDIIDIYNNGIIIDDKLSIDDFTNSRILNMSSQYSCIIKYVINE